MNTIPHVLGNLPSDSFLKNQNAFKQFVDIVSDYFEQGVVSKDELDKILLFSMKKACGMLYQYIDEYNHRAAGVSQSLINFMSDKEQFVYDIKFLSRAGYILNIEDVNDMKKVFLTTKPKALECFLFACLKSANSKWLEMEPLANGHARQSTNRIIFIDVLANSIGLDSDDKGQMIMFRMKMRYLEKQVKNNRSLRDIMPKSKKKK